MEREFEPSADFVERTMGAVRTHEAARREKAQKLAGLMETRAFLAASGAAAGTLGLAGLVRAWVVIFSPAVCF